MKVFTYLDDIENIGPTAVALGNFDGVHKGHQALISACVKKAKAEGLTSVVFTFLNHPNNVIAGKPIVKSIMSVYEKTVAIEALGIDILVTAYFTPEVMKMMPDDFVKTLLVDTLDIKEAFCGFNYSYGFKALGSPETLDLSGARHGFGVNILPEVEIDGKTVSSTLLREQIDNGDMEGYELFTGRRYTISGRVMEGRHLGRRIGFPTVNLNLSDEMALPANGVYITQTYVDDRLYPSITNIGKKPTIGSFDKNAETHLFGFEDVIYGKSIRVVFIKMMRPEYKFESIDSLQEEIRRNCITAKEYHERSGLIAKA